MVPTLSDRLNRAGADQVVLVGRILIGVIFAVSGFGKLTGLAAFAAVLESRGIPASNGIPMILAAVGAAVETFGGLALMLGLAIRPAALLMVAFVVVATGLSHRFWEFEGAARRAQEISFEKNVAIAGGLLLLFATGGGRFALDRLWRRH